MGFKTTRRRSSCELGRPIFQTGEQVLKNQAISFWCCKGIDEHETSCPFHPDYCNRCKTSACRCGAREVETLIAKCLSERRLPKNSAQVQSKLSLTRRLFRLLREGATR